jgi:DHA2 family lincomycin resistance protein-like MFS transporter
MSDTASITLPGATVPGTGGAASTNNDARNRLVITLLLVSTFVVILNETLMSVALPRLQEDLHISADVAQWLTTAFLLTMAIVIPITGMLLQRFQTRTVYIAAMTLFSTGTLLAAVAPGFPLLVIARVVQASGTAIMFPLLLTTVMTLVKPEARGRVMGNISIAISVAPALGPTVSGLILSVLDWRWIFILVLPIAVAALIVGAVRVPNVTEPRSTPLDILSVVLSALGFGGLVFGLSNIGSAPEGIAAPTSWIPLAVGVLGLALFIVRQLFLQRKDGALLDLRTFQSRTFTLSIAMFTIGMMSFLGVLILIPQYTVYVLGLDTLATGLLLLPGGLVMGLLGPVVGRLYDRFGPRWLVVAGAAVVSLALWGMTMLGAGTAPYWVLVAHVTLSVGLAFTFTPLFTASLGSVKPQLYSHGSAIVATMQQIAGAAGIALFVTVMTAHIRSELSAGASVVDATATGIHSAFVVGAIISLLAIPLAFFISKPADAPEGAPAMH